MTTYIYLLSGKSLNGKDTLYDSCKESGWVRVSFADKLKATVADLYNFSHEQMHGSLKDVMDERYPNLYDAKELETFSEEDFWHECPIKIPNTEYKPFLTPRRVLQVFGQQQRSLFPDIWASYIFTTEIPRLKKLGHNKFVITDTRFKNEIKVAEKFLEKDTVLIKVRIVRPNVFAKSGSNDISEIDLDDYKSWDYVITNDTSMDDLKLKGLNLIKEVESKY